MPSYKNLIIIALAASSVSPALSAPTREQKQSRGGLEERRSFGGSSKSANEAPESRAIAELEGRNAGAGLLIGSLLSFGLMLPLLVGHKHERDVSPSQMVAALNALDKRADVPEINPNKLEDSDSILHLLSRALNEFD